MGLVYNAGLMVGTRLTAEMMDACTGVEVQKVTRCPQGHFDVMPGVSLKFCGLCGGRFELVEEERPVVDPVSYFGNNLRFDVVEVYSGGDVEVKWYVGDLHWVVGDLTESRDEAEEVDLLDLADSTTHVAKRLTEAGFSDFVVGVHALTWAR